MENRLFNIEAKSTEKIIHFTTYKKNRIAKKLLTLLDSGGVYSVRSGLNQKYFSTFEITITSKRTKEEELKAFQNELISYIPDNFPSNYQFSVGKRRLGFIFSFTYCIDNGETSTPWFHNIKEINKNSLIPDKNIFL